MLAATELVRTFNLHAAVTSDGGYLTVAGYASLMDEASARQTTPSLRHFRYGRIRGYARVFNLVSIINIRRGLAAGRHLATATARPEAQSGLFVCLYEIPVTQLPQLLHPRSCKVGRLSGGTSV